MRKVAKTRNHLEIKQVILYDCGDGVYLFPCTSVEDGFAVGDEWYETLEIAEAVCNEEYGITDQDWKIIPDPPEGCQHDWIAPVRVFGSNTGNPQWGRLEIFPLSQAIKRAQDIIRRYVPEGRSLSNELIAERRQENLRD